MGVDRQRGWIVAIALGVTLVLPAAARAAVELPVPDGWADDVSASPTARGIADQWAGAMSGSVGAVRATKDEDDYVEIAVAIDQAMPMPAAALTDEAAALEQLRASVAPIFDATGEPVQRQFVTVDGINVLRARWSLGAETWEALAVPDGAARTVVIMRARTSELVFYDGAFDKIATGLHGATQPIRPLARTTWRGVGGGGLFALAGILFGIMLATGDVARDFEAAGKRGAVAQAVATGIVALLGFVYLSSRADAVAAAGTSPAMVMLELVVVGLLAAGALLIVGRRLDSGQTRIQSAPDLGTFRQQTPRELRESTEQAAVPKPVEDLPPR